MSKPGKPLGVGAYGAVYKGSWQFAEVAIKQLKLGHLTVDGIKDLKLEAGMMQVLTAILYKSSTAKATSS